MPQDHVPVTSDAAADGHFRVGPSPDLESSLSLNAWDVERQLKTLIDRAGSDGGDVKALLAEALELAGTLVLRLKAEAGSDSQRVLAAVSKHKALVLQHQTLKKMSVVQVAELTEKVAQLEAKVLSVRDDALRDARIGVLRKLDHVVDLQQVRQFRTAVGESHAAATACSQCFERYTSEDAAKTNGGRTEQGTSKYMRARCDLLAEMNSLLLVQLREQSEYLTRLHAAGGGHTALPDAAVHPNKQRAMGFGAVSDCLFLRRCVDTLRKQLSHTRQLVLSMVAEVSAGFAKLPHVLCRYVKEQLGGASVGKHYSNGIVLEEFVAGVGRVLKASSYAGKMMPDLTVRRPPTATVRDDLCFRLQETGRRFAFLLARFDAACLFVSSIPGAQDFRMISPRDLKQSVEEFKEGWLACVRDVEEAQVSVPASFTKEGILLRWSAACGTTPPPQLHMSSDDDATPFAVDLSFSYKKAKRDRLETEVLESVKEELLGGRSGCTDATVVLLTRTVERDADEVRISARLQGGGLTVAHAVSMLRYPLPQPAAPAESAGRSRRHVDGSQPTQQQQQPSKPAGRLQRVAALAATPERGGYRFCSPTLSCVCSPVVMLGEMFAVAGVSEQDVQEDSSTEALTLVKHQMRQQMMFARDYTVVDGARGLVGGLIPADQPPPLATIPAPPERATTTTTDEAGKAPQPPPPADPSLLLQPPAKATPPSLLSDNTSEAAAAKKAPRPLPAAPPSPPPPPPPLSTGVDVAVPVKDPVVAPEGAAARGAPPPAKARRARAKKKGGTDADAAGGKDIAKGTHVLFDWDTMDEAEVEAEAECEGEEEGEKGTAAADAAGAAAASAPPCDAETQTDPVAALADDVPPSHPPSPTEKSAVDTPRGAQPPNSAAASSAPQPQPSDPTHETASDASCGSGALRGTAQQDTDDAPAEEEGSSAALAQEERPCLFVTSDTRSQPATAHHAMSPLPPPPPPPPGGENFCTPFAAALAQRRARGECALDRRSGSVPRTAAAPAPPAPETTAVPPPPPPPPPPPADTTAADPALPPISRPPPTPEERWRWQASWRSAPVVARVVVEGVTPPELPVLGRRPHEASFGAASLMKGDRVRILDEGTVQPLVARCRAMQWDAVYLKLCGLVATVTATYEYHGLVRVQTVRGSAMLPATAMVPISEEGFRFDPVGRLNVEVDTLQHELRLRDMVIQSLRSGTYTDPHTGDTHRVDPNCLPHFAVRGGGTQQRRQPADPSSHPQVRTQASQTAGGSGVACVSAKPYRLVPEAVESPLDPLAVAAAVAASTPLPPMPPPPRRRQCGAVSAGRRPHASPPPPLPPVPLPPPPMSRSSGGSSISKGTLTVTGLNGNNFAAAANTSKPAPMSAASAAAAAAASAASTAPIAPSSDLPRPWDTRDPRHPAVQADGLREAGLNRSGVSSVQSVQLYAQSQTAVVERR